MCSTTAARQIITKPIFSPDKSYPARARELINLAKQDLPQAEGSTICPGCSISRRAAERGGKEDFERAAKRQKRHAYHYLGLIEFKLGGPVAASSS